MADGGPTNLDVAIFDTTQAGYHYFLAGAPSYSGTWTGEGAVYGFYPDGSGIYPSSPTWTVTGFSDYANFGQSIGGIVDFIGSGFPGVIVGAPYYSTNSSQIGRVYVYYGNGAGFDTTPDWIASGSSGSEFGSAVAWGMVTGDGTPALFVGAPGLEARLSLRIPRSQPKPAYDTRCDVNGPVQRRSVRFLVGQPR